MIKVTILGSAGRMGQTLIRCMRHFPRLSLVGAVESDHCPVLGNDAGIVAGIERVGVVLSADIRGSVGQADVMIEFSSPSATVEHTAIVAKMNKAMVIGTTGLDRKQTAEIKKASASTPIVWTPNMSMGVNLLFNLVEKAAGILRGYDVEIIETHHRHKKDAPSGTALRLAEAAAAARGLDPVAVMTHGRQGQVGPRPVNQIGVHAVRAGDVVGDHTVIFAADGERVELTHRATSRECFAMGALQAAEWVVGRKPGLYTMQHVLKLTG